MTVEFHYTVKWSEENGWELAPEMDEYLSQDRGVVYDSAEADATGSGWRDPEGSEEQQDAANLDELRNLIAPTTKPRNHLMSRIGDDLYVGWDTCARCGNYMTACRCLGGPVEPTHIAEWRKQRNTPVEPPVTREAVLTAEMAAQITATEPCQECGAAPGEPCELECSSYDTVVEPEPEEPIEYDDASI